MKRIIFPVLALIMLVSCSKDSRYKGFSKTDSGIYYKLHSFGESKKEVKPGDYITSDITYKKMNDSVFFDGRRKFQISEPSFEGSIDECFLMLTKGEKATFILPAKTFFNKTLETSLPSFFNESDSLKVVVDLIEVQRKDEFLREKEAFLNWIKDFGDYEKVQLQQFLEEKNIDAKPTESGLYRVVLSKGDGTEVEEGDTVVIHYEGKFLNGKFFDSTKQRKQPLEFVYGTKMQVIEGMNEIIGEMHEGEKALAILPSDKAFGRAGSSTGIIPPYTSVIYEIDLVEVRKNTENSKS
ncbi:MAG: FKBP-type peptidyl-prolyl cis-trans isomerase [Bacteroidota bacterium]